MSDHNLPPEPGDGYLAAQLARLEHMLAEQAARMHIIERQLGIQRAAQPARPFNQGTTPATPPQHTPQTNGQRDAVLPLSPQFSVTDATTEQTARTTAPPSVTTDEQAATGTHEATDHEPAAGYEPAWRTHDAKQARPASGEQAASGPRASANAPAAATVVTRSWGDLETLIAGKLFLWLGMILGTLAVAFFLKLAFDNQWIGPTGRVLLGGAAGCALLALAERLRLRGYQAYAYVLSGGGILILYLSVYAAFDFYQLLSQPPAFALMAVVTATAVLLAARYDAYAIAVLGLIGGFMTPSLLATNVDNEVGLFGYAALLNAGVLALAYFKRWRSLNYLAFAATWVLFAGWYFKYYGDAKLWPTLFFLTLFFGMFAALAIIHNVLKEHPTRWFDISLLLTNATLYFATSYALLEDHQRLTAAAFYLQGPHALLLSGFFGLLYFIARQKHRTDKLLTYTYVAAAVTFLTMAVAIQLDQLWVTIGWGIEALMLTWIGLRAEEDAPRFAALPVFTVAVMHWFIVDMPEFGYRTGVAFQPLLNKRAVSCAVLVGVCAGVTWLYRRYRERVNDDDRDILRSLFVLAGNTLALALLTTDLNDYFNQAIARDVNANGNSVDMLENARQFALTTLWTFYAAVALTVGLLRRLQPLRYAALLALLYPVTKLLLLDVRYYSAPWHVAVFNSTFFGFVVVVAALAFCVRAYARADHVDARERSSATAALLASAHLVALVGLSAETMGYFNRAKALAWSLPDSGRAAARVENDKQLVLSAIWTIYAACAFVIGLRRNRVALRYGALALLAIAGAKILLVDATYYNATWHALLFNQTAAAFALYVGALYVVAHLYARAGDKTAYETARIVPFVTVVGNIFALTALSLETSGYFAAQRDAGAVAAGQLRDLRLARQLSLSVLWAVYGGALLVFGLARRNRLLRVMALALLGLTTGKVFLFDLASLDKLYRIISFIVLGAILLAVSFLYQQRQQRAARAEES